MAGPVSPVTDSWVKVKPDSDFPIQNLPFGIFSNGRARAGVAIGDHILDLDFLEKEGFLPGLDLPQGLFADDNLNAFLSLGRTVLTSVRNRIAELLAEGNESLTKDGRTTDTVLVHKSNVRLLKPVRIPNYTDFYSSREHASNVGAMFRDPANPLLPNWLHIPVGYHGRASSIVVSGTPVRRPWGQIKLPDSETPVFSPTRKLDFELEAGFVTCGETQPGSVITTAEAMNHIAGMVLFNDWSARDIQQWEYVPLGPFLGKNFASTMSPWIVTLDALEPARCEGPVQTTQVLPYLRTPRPSAYDIKLEVLLRPANSEAVVICRSNYKYLYWNMVQQLAHHTVNGCNIEVGDLYASGTISGPSPGSYGSLLELSWNGRKALVLPDGTERIFLEDGDTIILRGFAEHNGRRIGFGECSGTIEPALSL